jgi:hypothetical protein
MMNDAALSQATSEYQHRPVPDFDTEDWGDFAEDMYDPDDEFYDDLAGEFSDVAQGMYDDDPSPYDGNYSEM